MSTSPRVKVCGLMRHADAAAAFAAGAWYGGVILTPGFRRSVDPAAASSVFAGLGLRRVGVFVNADADAIRDAVETVGLDVVQLHGDEGPDAAADLRIRAGVTIWKAVRIRTAADFMDAVTRFGGAVDGLLLDGSAAGARGGAGVSFPWEAVAECRHALGPDTELVLAGGLRPENVARAASLLLPTTVDVSSGVESEPGTKDHVLIRAFVDAARSSAVSS